jgi:hypothetical protein
MEIDFWYSNIVPNSNIRNCIEKIGIKFKNIDTDSIEITKLNFLVFNWETHKIHSISPNTKYTHSKQFLELLNKLQIQKFYFIADYSGESYIRLNELSLSFLNKLKLNDIDINRLIVANNNSNKVGIDKAKYKNFVLNTIFFPNFFLSTYDYLKNYIGDISTDIVPDKKFLCLNRRMYYHKYQIIEELFNRNLLNDTRFSWVDNKNIKNLSNKKLINHLEIDVNSFKSIQLEDDVMYGTELSKHEEYLYTINTYWYYKCKVNII